MQFKVVQGGMGVGVSGWPLARAVSKNGGLGVVSSTGLDMVVARRLQLGDPGGHMRRAFRRFPIRGVAGRVLAEYFINGGKPPNAPFRPVPLFSIDPPQRLIELTVLANFAEVWLAKKGHDGSVGINLLEKIQLPTLPSLFGAMLAGVDVVLMGAGIPRSIPGILDEFSRGNPAQLKLEVEDAQPDSQFTCRFDPHQFCAGPPPPVRRPAFLAVISSATLALTLARKATGMVDGFIVEGPSAGGHNAPPRGPTQRDASGQPIYTDRDHADLEKIRGLGRPFWLAGSFGRPEKLREALNLGATGIQVGTPFAFCEESGIDPSLKSRVLDRCRTGQLHVFTDPTASPTGLPFKILPLEGTAAELPRQRVCDMGYLRRTYEKSDGTLGYRCSGEPVENYVKKGGTESECAGRKCICNGLMATAGFAQLRGDSFSEPPLLTTGDGVNDLIRFLRPNTNTYRAADVMAHLNPTPAAF